MKQRALFSGNLLAYLALALAMSFVGTSMAANKFIVGEVPVMLTGTLRFLIATVFILSLTLLVDRRLPSLDGRTHLTILAQTFFGTFLFNIFALYGVGMTTAMVSGIILAATPAVVAIMSWLLGDRLARVAWLGVLLIVGGVMLVNLLDTPDDSVASRPWLGAILIFLAVVSEALYTMFGRLIATKGSPLGLASWFTLYGTAMFLPFGLWDLRTFDIATITPATWLALAYMGAIVGATAALLWYFGLRSVPASIAGAFTGMMPITAVLSAWLLLNERIGWPHVFGIAIIITGILIVARSRGAEISPPPERIEILPPSA